MVFLWFSYGFPIVFLWFPMDFPRFMVITMYIHGSHWRAAGHDAFEPHRFHGRPWCHGERPKKRRKTYRNCGACVDSIGFSRRNVLICHSIHGICIPLIQSVPPQDTSILFHPVAAKCGTVHLLHHETHSCHAGYNILYQNCRFFWRQLNSYS